MRVRVGVIVFNLILVSCTTADKRFLADQLDQIREPQTGTILLEVVGADGSINAIDKGDAPSDLRTRSG